MKKFGTLITSALATIGIAAGAMAADMPKTSAPSYADTPAASGTSSDAPKPAKKHHKKKKKAAAPSTT